MNGIVYINDAAYNNYSITVSSNYTVILKVYDLNFGDPTMYWKYSPAAVIPKNNEGNLQSPDLYNYVAIGILITVILVIGVSAVIKKKRN